MIVPVPMVDADKFELKVLKDDEEVEDLIKRAYSLEKKKKTLKKFSAMPGVIRSFDDWDLADAYALGLHDCGVDVVAVSFGYSTRSEPENVFVLVLGDAPAFRAAMNATYAHLIVDEVHES